jgi:hypothetical protein
MAMWTKKAKNAEASEPDRFELARQLAALLAEELAALEPLSQEAEAAQERFKEAERVYNQAVIDARTATAAVTACRWNFTRRREALQRTLRETAPAVIAEFRAALIAEITKHGSTGDRQAAMRELDALLLEPDIAVIEATLERFAESLGEDE